MTRIGELVGLSALNGAPLQPAVDAIKGIIANGHKKVLVVGVRGDNFTEEYREHPQLMFWNSLDRDAARIPVRVGLVLVTRFVGHDVYNDLKQQAKSMGAVFVNHPLGTGQIRELLKPFIKEHKHEEPVTFTAVPQEEAPVNQQTQPQLRGFARGELQKFVEDNVNLDARPVILELRRLVALAKEQGIETTENSLNSAYYRIVRSKDEPVDSPKQEDAQPQAIEKDDAELLVMLDDAIAALGLVRQAIKDRAPKRSQLLNLLKHL